MDLQVTSLKKFVHIHTVRKIDKQIGRLPDRQKQTNKQTNKQNKNKRPPEQVQMRQIGKHGKEVDPDMFCTSSQEFVQHTVYPVLAAHSKFFMAIYHLQCLGPCHMHFILLDSNECGALGTNWILWALPNMINCVKESFKNVLKESLLNIYLDLFQGYHWLQCPWLPQLKVLFLTNHYIVLISVKTFCTYCLMSIQFLASEANDSGLPANMASTSMTLPLGMRPVTSLPRDKTNPNATA